MNLSEERLDDFYNHYFGHHSLLQSPEISNPHYFLSCGLDLKLHRTQSMNYVKSIKDYGFLKRYQTVCAAMPYVSNIRPEQVQVKLLSQVIEEVYRCYNLFAKRGLWKSKQHQSYLQQFLLMYLHELYVFDLKLKRKYSHWDRFVINVFFTLNILKTCNNYMRSFANFLHPSFSFSELFLYLCLKNMAVVSNNEEVVDSHLLRKVIKVFQSEETQTMSEYTSKESSQNDSGKLVSINSIFLEPLGGSLSFPKVKMYKIMKLCKYSDCESITDEIEWSEFLKQYFQAVESGGQICFQHVVSSAVSHATVELSKKLLHNQPKQVQQQFLEQAFGYVFEILEAVFAEQQPQIQNGKTLENIRNLRIHLEYLRRLSEQNIHVMNKFCKKILKNNYVLELYKKYT